jgi:EmrB/QacA subfamily drug resistance transporter
MTESGISRGTLMALVAMAAGVFLIANDFTALSVAIPAIEQEFGTSLGTAQWVVNGYTVVFGVLVVTGGRLADMIGRRKVFVVGAAIFAAFSLIGAIAPTIEVLIASRALMGIGGALMWPAILGMTYAILPAERAGLAGGLILGVAGLGNAFGPLLGGILTDTLGWAWVFLLNVPITIVAVWITLRYVPESQVSGAERKIDVQGVATLSAGVIALLVALDMGSSSGYTDPAILLLFGVGLALLVIFAVVEIRQGEAALVPSSVMVNRQFAVAALMTLMMSALFFAVVIYLPQLMEKDLGFSAIGAGAGLLPMMITFAATSFAAGAIYGRLGGRIVVSAGAAALAGGMLLLSFLEADAAYIDLVPGMIVVGVGVGLFYSSITTTAVTAVDGSQASLAGGIIYMAQIAGGSLGLGINTAIVVAAPTLAEGVSRAFLLDALLALAALIIALLFLGTPGRIREQIHVPARHRAHAP